VIADLLSASRLALAIPFAWSLLDPERPLLAAGLLAVAIVTDFADGWVARRTGTESPRGRLLDHGSDFVFVEAGLAALAVRGAVPWLLPPLVAVAFAQYVVDSLVVERREQLRPNPLGRWNGVLYFVLPVVEIASRLTDLLAWLAPAVPLFAWALCASTLASIGSRLLAVRRARRSA
jgi:phosphatidylglycerophosphate synthase